MITTPTRALACLTILAALAGCDTRAPGDSGDAADESAARAEYAREIFFIAADATGAAVLDFTAADVGTAVRRTSRAWVEAGSGWTPLYDLAWDGGAVRRPWRLVPRGPVRIRVGLGDEVEAIAVREDAEDLALLETGDFVAEWAPFGTTQVVLREATLALGDEPMRGWVVDARFGVTRQAADDTTGGFEPPPVGTQDDSAGAAAGTPDSAVADDSTAESMPATESTRPVRNGAMAVRALRGVLVGAGGETLVLGQTDDGIGGWLWTADGETTLPAVTLTRVEGEREGWSILAGGTLSGSLSVMDEEPLPVSPRIVRGTIEIDGDTIAMHGVLRPEDFAD